MVQVEKFKMQENGGEGIHVCIRLSHFAVPLKLSERYQWAILQYKIKSFFFKKKEIYVIKKKKKRCKKEREIDFLSEGGYFFPLLKRKKGE